MDNKITIGIFMLMLASGFIFISYDNSDYGVKLMSEDDYEEYETNYEGLFKLGLVPSTNSRYVQKNDIDTGIKLRDGDGSAYYLMESRTWGTGDYGKTFIVKIE